MWLGLANEVRPPARESACKMPSPRRISKNPALRTSPRILTKAGRDEMSDTVTLPVPKTRPEEKEKIRRQPPYHVILVNDDDHTYDYVIRMLKQLFGADGFGPVDESSYEGLRSALSLAAKTEDWDDLSKA